MYEVYQSDVVNDHYHRFNKECIELANLIRDKMKDSEDHVHQQFNNSTTWCYNLYNVWTLTGASTIWWDLYIDICDCIRQYVGHNRPLWMQAWLNSDTADNVIGWHNHRGCEFHGYVGLVTHDTTTVFKNYRIDNAPGKIYIGPALNEHKVVVNTPYQGERYTLAFNVVNPMTVDATIDRHIIVPIPPRVK